MMRHQDNRSILFLLLVLLSGCSASMQALQERPIRIFYATDRARSGKTDAAKFFGTEKDTLSYGTCNVKVPPVHVIGRLESPILQRNPERHIVLSGIQPSGEGEFYEHVRRFFRESRSREAVIYIHGFNMSFDETARRMAQISEDLGLGYAPVFFSWPSQAKLGAYRRDEEKIESCEKELEVFLESFVRNSGAEKIILVAHSMGNRAMCAAFSSITTKHPELGRMFRELVLAAPDIDAEQFTNRIGPSIAGRGPSITLYASSHDKALEASKEINGDKPRAGDVNGGPVMVTGIETIDATNADTSFLGHSYYSGSRSVLADIYYLIGSGLRAGERFSLEPVDMKGGRYWRFKK
jgi:esterase/lipase superfamily enzyme